MHALDRVSIIPRGRTGGVTMFQPDEDRVDHAQSELLAMLVMSMGGRAADRLVIGEPLSGAIGDLKQATRIARAMVTQMGMSDRLGPRTFGKTDEMIFLGREISETRNYSEKIAEEIDDEVRRLIEDAQERARTVLREHRDLLDKLALVLLEVETLEGPVLTRLLNSDPKEPWPPADLQKPDETPASPPPTEERRPTFEPKPTGGLAWEGGNQTRADGGSV